MKKQNNRTTRWFTNSTVKTAERERADKMIADIKLRLVAGIIGRVDNIVLSEASIARAIGEHKRVMYRVRICTDDTKHISLKHLESIHDKIIAFEATWCTANGVTPWVPTTNTETVAKPQSTTKTHNTNNTNNTNPMDSGGGTLSTTLHIALGAHTHDDMQMCAEDAE